jgi:frataxin
MMSSLEATLDDLDITISQGVLTINLGPAFQNKTWVINKQTPNRQIWWSSPISGPRRFEFDTTSQRWLFTKDKQVELSESLRKEVEKVTGTSLTF